jgi:hypothetical protein
MEGYKSLDFLLSSLDLYATSCQTIPIYDDSVADVLYLCQNPRIFSHVFRTFFVLQNRTKRRSVAVHVSKLGNAFVHAKWAFSKDQCEISRADSPCAWREGNSVEGGGQDVDGYVNHLLPPDLLSPHLHTFFFANSQDQDTIGSWPCVGGVLPRVGRHGIICLSEGCDIQTRDRIMYASLLVFFL